MDEPIDVTIVVAAYDEERLLPRCLSSIAALEGPRAEVIVVDNGSTDRTAEIAAAHAFVRVVREPCLGAVHAKAAGVAAARGALVAILDADSTCPPDWLTHIRVAFAEDAQLVGLTGPARYVDGRAWVPYVIWSWYAWWRVVGFFARRAVYAVGTNVAFRREAYTCSAGFDTRLLVGGDEIALFSSLSKVGKTRYDPHLVVSTDARRGNLGLVRFFWEVFLLRYVLNYAWCKLTGRTLTRGYTPGSSLARR
ncbi:MAG: glycosyltransferase family 2 protein [Polyangia bacterium]